MSDINFCTPPFHSLSSFPAKSHNLFRFYPPRDRTYFAKKSQNSGLLITDPVRFSKTIFGSLCGSVCKNLIQKRKKQRFYSQADQKGGGGGGGGGGGQPPSPPSLHFFTNFFFTWSNVSPNFIKFFFSFYKLLSSPPQFLVFLSRCLENYIFNF